MKRTSASTDAMAMSMEEKERRIMEERAQNELKLQRKYKLEQMMKKRHANLRYLKRVHEGHSYWMNTVLFSESDVDKYISTAISKQRIESYFSLGLSISKILKLGTGLDVVRGFSQLLEEWEYMNSGTAMQSVKYVMAKNSSCIYPQMNPIDGLSDLLRPSVYKFNNAVVFEYLEDPHVAFDLDYVEVLYGLCDELIMLYESIVSEECYSDTVVYDAIMRLDSRIKYHIINLISKEINEICLGKVKSTLATPGLNMSINTK